MIVLDLTYYKYQHFFKGYYLFFATASVYNSAGRALRRGLRHYFVPPTPPASSTTTTTDPSSPPPRPPLLAPYKPIYDLIGTLLCMFFTNYIAAPFQVLTIQKSIRVWGSIYYIGHVGLLMIFIGLKALKRAFGGGGEGGGGRKSTTVKKNE